MLAVLEDALRTVLSARVGRSSDAWVRDELRWFTSEDRSHPFAFEVICDVLDLDASWLRRRLRKHRAIEVRNATSDEQWGFWSKERCVCGPSHAARCDADLEDDTSAPRTP